MKIISIFAFLQLTISLFAQDSIPANRVDRRLSGFYDKVGKKKFFQDNDQDGYGNISVFLLKWTQPAGYVLDSTDCNDSSNLVRPGAIEVCNGIDDDCDSLTTEPPCNVISVTNTGRLLNKDLFSADLEDFCFTGGNNIINVISEPYLSRIKEIGFTSLMYGNSSPNHYYKVIVGDTLIYNSSCDGYCCVPEHHNSSLGGACDDYFGVNFYNLADKLSDTLGIPLNFGFNSEFGTIGELQWMIERGNPTFIQECLECYSNGYNNQTTWINGGYSYKEKMDTILNDYLTETHPNIKRGGDAKKPVSPQSWNSEVNGLNVHYWGFYRFDTMFMPEDCGDTPDEWLQCINEAVQNNLPLSLDSTQNQFAGYKLGGMETGLDNTYKKQWYGTMLGNLYLVKQYKRLIEYNLENNDAIDVWVFKSLKSTGFHKDEPKASWYGLKQIGEIFKGDTVYTVQTNIENVYGMANENTILIANDNNYEVNFTFDNNQIPISSHTIYANDLISTTIIEEDITGTILKRNSITVFKF